MAKGRGTSDPETTITEEMITAIKKEAVGYIAKIVIATIAGIIVIAGLGLWLYVKTLLPTVAGGVPAGAVMPFDLSEGCPAGWSYFGPAIGRTIIGATNQSPPNNEMLVANKAYRASGGRPSIQLTADNLPPFSLDFYFVMSSGYGDKPANVVRTITNIKNSDSNGTVNLAFVPRPQQPIPSVMPYLSLYYCKKTDL